MEQTLAEDDRIDYIWYSREYVLVSMDAELVRYVQFCPFCGEDLGKDSVRYAYDEAVRIEFLTNLEVEAEEEAAKLTHHKEGSQEQVLTEAKLQE
jgi:hypothetical protein